MKTYNNLTIKLLFQTLLCLTIFFSINPPASGKDAAESFTELHVVSISGDVDPAMAAFLKRALKDIEDKKDTLIIIEMDTFGGRVDSALDMVESILNVRNASTMAYVVNKAISAGALISLSCNQLFMRKNTTIGDCAPITYSNEGAKMMGEKFQSPLRAKFRTLARKNGYPQTLAEAMVTVDMEVLRVDLDGKILYMDAEDFKELDKQEKEKVKSKKTVVSKTELLTMDDVEAAELGFSKMSVENIDDLLKKMHLSHLAVNRVEKSWSEDLVSFVGTIVPLLMLIGLAALYTEIKAPGLGAPAIIGVICLALVFFSQYLVGLADYTEMILIAFGLVLLAYEEFVIPGFGIAGISGIICLCIGMVLGLQDFVIPDPEMPWQKEILIRNLIISMSSFLGAIGVSLFVLRYVFPKLPKVVDGPYLDTTLQQARVENVEAQRLKVGQPGTAITFLRPAGKIKIEGEVYDAISEAEFIEKNAPVEILKISGTKIIVVRREPHGN